MSLVASTGDLFLLDSLLCCFLPCVLNFNGSRAIDKNRRAALAFFFPAMTLQSYQSFSWIPQCTFSLSYHHSPFVVSACIYELGLNSLNLQLFWDNYVDFYLVFLVLSLRIQEYIQSGVNWDLIYHLWPKGVILKFPVAVFIASTIQAFNKLTYILLDWSITERGMDCSLPELNQCYFMHLMLYYIFRNVI